MARKKFKVEEIAAKIFARQKVAGTTGLEPATSSVTSSRSSQLNYVPLALKASINLLYLRSRNKSDSVSACLYK